MPRRSWLTETRRGLVDFAALLIVLAIVWEAIRRLGSFDRRLLPSSWEIATAVVQELAGQRLWVDLGMTLFRALGGLVLAALVAIPSGLAVGSGRASRRIGLPLIDFLRSVPVTSLYPVFVLTLGIGDRGKIGMVFLSSALVIALAAASAFDRRSLVRHQVARLYGASRAQLLFHVSLFEALPSILTGLRIATGLAMIVSTLTEMFMGADRGMGQSLMEAYSIYNLPVMYAYILSLGTVGFGLNRLCAAAEDQTHRWGVR